MQCEIDETDSITGLSLALGWFSIALGAAELVAPGQVARLLGVPPSDRTRTILRAYGARELATGIGILSRPTDPKWLWSRVGGDALDLATLGQAARNEGIDQSRLASATLAVLGVTALDVLAARSLQLSSQPFDQFSFSPAEEQAITVKVPFESAEAAWALWHQSGQSRLQKNYAVRFEPAPGARGTEMHIAGGGSKSTIREELKRFKQVVETGEIIVSDGPGLRRPAQPARDPIEVKNLAEVL